MNDQISTEAAPVEELTKTPVFVQLPDDLGPDGETKEGEEVSKEDVEAGNF